MEGLISGAFGDADEGLRFHDWTRIVATERPKHDVDHQREFSGGDEQILKEREHRSARERLQRWLIPTEKWHFLLGYRSVRAYSAARRLTQGAALHHLPTRNSSVHFVLSFISVGSAEVIRSTQMFHVVEPLLPYLKIEDLTLGRLIREEDSQPEALGLKATLAHNALSLREVKRLAERWEVALEVESQGSLFSLETLRFSDTAGQMGIDSVGREREMRRNGLHGIECSVSTTAIVCSPIAQRSLQRAANFMASHAVVQLVELTPRYEVFNKWAKYVTQVSLSVALSCVLISFPVANADRRLLFLWFQSVSETHLPIFNKGLRGEGEVIACADTGIDMDVRSQRKPYVQKF